ncbi:hypothetical protein CR152_05880 [Massilia violaceinigra]|uniref:Uncharacterized protein n=1 Tax=Massilia violaceinigra TaxID=2045208 RepID=A0A2D2DGJ5_9BURK|nr:hypothetical protein [Massilia violaceinigra]ATQ74097.1 hypothetical protein CR152_05880 [Massilia violaceinigra]
MRSGFMRFGAFAVVGLTMLAAGVFIGREFDVDAEPDGVLVPEWYGNKRPDAQLFRDVREGLQTYRMRDVPLGPGDLRLVEDPQTGLIQTAWFLVHKGESSQKVQIAVWGSLYRIDVWTRSTLTGKIEKTFFSRVAEREIQQAIEKVRHSRGAAVTSPAS